MDTRRNITTALDIAIVPDCGHSPRRDRADAMLQAVSKFMETISPVRESDLSSEIPILEPAGMIQHLEALGWTEFQRAVAIGLIIGRMAAPGSELATHCHRWLSEISALGELLGEDY